MKAFAIAAIISTTLLNSCEAAPQRGKPADSVLKKSAPGVKVIKPDSPADTRMPVIHSDTARQENMPVVTPPKNVQPK